MPKYTRRQTYLNIYKPTYLSINRLEKHIITLTFFRPIGHTGDDNHRYCGFVWFMTVGNELEGVKFTLRGVGQRLGARV